MASVNKAIILGNLGKAPEVRYMPSGDAVCNFSVATTDTWKDKDGNKKEQTEWHRCSAFGKLADICGEYLKKGSQVYIEGRIQTRKYQKDGQDHYATEIKVDVMRMLGSKADHDTKERNQQSGGPAAPKAAASKYKGDGSFNDFEDSIPF